MQDDKATQLAAGIEASLAARFGENIQVDPALAGLDELAGIAGHRVHRHFSHRRSTTLLRLLCACALSAPSKSDLQQADILVVDDPAQRGPVIGLMPEMPWLSRRAGAHGVPRRRQPHPAAGAHAGQPFPNDHLDLMFNAAVDAAIVMTTFMRAAAAVGLGCCPLSAIRDHPDQVSHVLGCRSACSGRRHVRRLARQARAHHAAARPGDDPASGSLPARRSRATNRRL